MSKLKAGFVAAVMMILLGGFVMSLHQYSIWSYYTAAQALGFYGYIMAGVNLYKWLSKEEDTNAPQTFEDWAEYKG